jgi:hypothetical protein
MQQGPESDMPNIPIPPSAYLVPLGDSIQYTPPTEVQTTPRDRAEQETYIFNELAPPIIATQLQRVAQTVKTRPQELPPREAGSPHHEPVVGTKAKDSQTHHDRGPGREPALQQPI